MQPKAKYNDHYQQQFTVLEQGLNGLRESSFHQMRRAAFEAFVANGFPSPQVEDWKYTNLRPLELESFHNVPAEELKADIAYEGFCVPNLDSYRLVFVNGSFSEKYSQVTGLPSGVVLEALSTIFKDSDSPHRELVEKRLGKCAAFDEHALTALNTAFLQDGVLIAIEKGVVVDKPIELLFLSSSERSMVTYPRILVVAEESSQCSIVETYASEGDTPHFTNSVAEVLVAENANVSHCRMQREHHKSYHISRISAELKRDSKFATFSFSLGGGLVRNEVDPTLAGENCEVVMNGLSVLSGEQHVDNHTVLDHAVPNCESHELYKGIYDDKSRGVFCGTIIVRPDAQKTNAIQNNQSLLLSDSASIDSKPQLKIWADDVKCTHGATIGQLDEEALHYIRSRGVSKDEARNMLIHAFASEVFVDLGPESLRDHLEDLLMQKLG